MVGPGSSLPTTMCETPPPTSPKKKAKKKKNSFSNGRFQLIFHWASISDHVGRVGIIEWKMKREKKKEENDECGILVFMSGQAVLLYQTSRNPSSFGRNIGSNFVGFAIEFDSQVFLFRLHTIGEMILFSQVSLSLVYTFIFICICTLYKHYSFHTCISNTFHLDREKDKTKKKKIDLIWVRSCLIGWHLLSVGERRHTMNCFSSSSPKFSSKAFPSFFFFLFGIK